MNAIVALGWTPVGSTALSVKELLGKQPDITLSMIARAFSSAGLPITKEPSGLFRSDGKRPDGLTLVPGRAVKRYVGTSQ